MTDLHRNGSVTARLWGEGYTYWVSEFTMVERKASRMQHGSCSMILPTRTVLLGAHTAPTADSRWLVTPEELWTIVLVAIKRGFDEGGYNSTPVVLDSGTLL